MVVVMVVVACHGAGHREGRDWSRLTALRLVMG
jgi:hypothetical protein